MSLVGTRPILQDELLKYELHHRARIAIKPGITGMDFRCFLLFSAISMILLKKLCRFCATGVKSSAFCINILHLQFI